MNERKRMRESLMKESEGERKMDGINRKKVMKLIYNGHKSRIDGSVRLIILFMPNFYKLD